MTKYWFTQRKMPQAQRNNLFQIQPVGLFHVVVKGLQQRELVRAEIETQIRRFISFQVEGNGCRCFVFFQERAVFGKHLRIDGRRLETVVPGNQDRGEIHVLISEPFQTAGQLLAVVFRLAQVFHIVCHKFVVHRRITVFKLTTFFLLRYLLLPQQVQSSRTRRQDTVQTGSLDRELQHIIVRFQGVHEVPDGCLRQCSSAW